MSNLSIKRENKRKERESKIYCCIMGLLLFAFWSYIIYKAVDIFFK